MTARLRQTLAVVAGMAACGALYGLFVLSDGWRVRRVAWLAPASVLLSFIGTFNQMGRR